MQKQILNKKEIEIKFEEYLRKESKDRFYLRKKIGIKRLTNNYLRNARHNLLVAKMMMDVILLALNYLIQARAAQIP